MHSIASWHDLNFSCVATQIEAKIFPIVATGKHDNNNTSNQVCFS